MNAPVARRSSALFLTAMVAVLVLAPAGPARAQDDTPGENLGGYVGQASALAFSFQPVFPALVPTGDAPFEATVALTTANVKSGGNAFARSSVTWPGSAAANLGPLIGAGASQPAFGALIPKWPLVAEANHDSGEVETGAPPLVVMKATGHKDQAIGDSRLADVDVPGLVKIEHVASTSESVVTDGDVTARSRVVLRGVGLLDGHIQADKIVSVSETTSTAGGAVSDGKVAIAGLTIGGFEVTLTDDGFSATGAPDGAEQIPGFGGEPFPNQSPEAGVREVLKNLGARITLFESVGNARGGSADRLGTGVVLSVDNPAGGQGPVPPGRFDLILASTSAATLATEPFTFTPPTFTPTTQPPGGGGGTGYVPPSSSLGSGPQVAGTTVTNVGGPLGTVTTGGSAGRVTSGSPVPPLGSAPASFDYSFAGVPAGTALALLALAALAARYVRRFLAGLLPPTD